jgi:hypothetical protein
LDKQRQKELEKQQKKEKEEAEEREKTFEKDRKRPLVFVALDSTASLLHCVNSHSIGEISFFFLFILFYFCVFVYIYIYLFTQSLHHIHFYFSISVYMDTEYQTHMLRFYRMMYDIQQFISDVVSSTKQSFSVYEKNVVVDNDKTGRGGGDPDKSFLSPLNYSHYFPANPNGFFMNISK